MAHASHAKTSRANTRLPPEEDPEFQIAPMIDILLVLLVFFMSISSTEVLQVNQDVTLPVANDAKQSDKNSKGQTIVNVLWTEIGNKGTIIIDENRFNTAAEIVPTLSAGVKKNSEMRVLIRADKKVRYEFLKTVMVAAGQSGVGKVTFSVVDKEGKQK